MIFGFIFLSRIETKKITSLFVVLLASVYSHQILATSANSNTNVTVRHSLKHQVSKFSEFNQPPEDQKLTVATWNIRQTTFDKINTKIKVSGKSQQIFQFVENWLDLRSVDVLALQEFYEKTDLVSGFVESPLSGFENSLASKYEVILGKPIRDPILRGHSSVWKEYCPVIFNKEKLNCYGSDEAIEIGLDQHQRVSTLKTPRYVNWAYCESLDKKFNFVMSCVHTNFKTSENHVLGLKNVITKILNKEITYPERFLSENQDFIFAGDFNLDRRTTKTFESLAKKGVLLDAKVPVFPKGTRWKKPSFTKLKDIYTFAEARSKSTDIYDDVVHTLPMNESLLTKFVDPLIDDFFTSSTNKVDMKSLLGLSDHLPVITTYDLTLDTD